MSPGPVRLEAAANGSSMSGEGSRCESQTVSMASRDNPRHKSTLLLAQCCDSKLNHVSWSRCSTSVDRSSKGEKLESVEQVASRIAECQASSSEGDHDSPTKTLWRS